jgi:CTP synthase
MHLTLVPFIQTSGELKTKPTQHSVKELRSIGLTPDILVCRAKERIPEEEKKKLALFCNVKSDAIISAYDLKSIYDAPLAFHREFLDVAVLNAFQIKPSKKPDLSIWKDVSKNINFPEGEVRIAIVGKYTKLGDAYKSIAEALTHGGIANNTKVIAEWIDSEIFEKENTAAYLQNFSAILVPGGFGERGAEGKIMAAKFAREKKVPFFGICLGMQMAVVEAIRNLGEIKNASSEEFYYPYSDVKKDIVPIIFHLEKWIDKGKIVTRKVTDYKGGTMRLGAYDAILKSNSKVSKIYNAHSISERHRHRFEVDINYKEILEKNGFIFSGVSPDGLLPEIIEIPDHPWFVGVQFHPELKSKPFSPHPLFADFIKAALMQSRLV